MATTSVNFSFSSHSHCTSLFSSSSSSSSRPQISLFLSRSHQPTKKISHSSRLPSFSVNCTAMAAQKPLSDSRMLVFVPPHPLIKHWISVLRNEQTPCPIFKNAMSELGRLLIYEAARDWLPTVSGEIQTPMDVAQVEFIDPREPVAVIPILRAGLALAEHAASILPATKTYHLGVARDEETLQPTVYLNKLPESFPEGSRIFIVDPMLATGGTIVKAIEMVKERGVGNKQIKVVHLCLIYNHVVLDLDETLVCAYEKSSLPLVVLTHAICAGLNWFELECVSSNKEFEGKPKVNYVTVFERPRLHEFLEKLSGFADLVLFMAGLEGYARPLVDKIDVLNRISKRLYRPSTTRTVTEVIEGNGRVGAKVEKPTPKFAS